MRLHIAWQKVTNKNSNKLLREFSPKGQNLPRVREKTLKKDPALINASHKKVLHCQTPQYLFEENALKLLGAPKPIAKDYFIKEAERLKQCSLSDFDLSDLKYIKENT